MYKKRVLARDLKVERGLGLSGHIKEGWKVKSGKEGAEVSPEW